MEYIIHLKKDTILEQHIKQHGVFNLKHKKHIYFYLCNSIMSQQLSTKVADVFQRRFLELFNGKIPTAQQISATPFATLRAIGLSNAKAQYVLNVAAFELTQGMRATQLKKMSNEAIIDYLTQIKGVGKWTVEMLLMFALCREDIFPLDDLGIQNAMIKMYGIKHKDKKMIRKKMIKIAEQWSPYRTYACLYLWRSIDSPTK